MDNGGAVLGLIGGVLMTATGILALKAMNQMSEMVQLYGLTFESFGLDTTMINLNLILTLSWGILALIGAIGGFKKPKIGGIILIIVGIIAFAGLFIPLVPAKTLILAQGVTIPFPAIPMNSSFIFIDPILVAFGGIISVIHSYE